MHQGKVKKNYETIFYNFKKFSKWVEPGFEP